ncbi:LOW QUALITY PROTEIN: uncharacterized protein LOC112570787 [Pomacea canaliculata]|uniref:LOW QUALITY PROTEIN: uncharacterized protein LOC112570787 n=1 Tax=Pomacea canaliculata TaxID=400727 RepID=UPI000D733A22|nr:LOW QUALITY PROTEIN: uncharacterized protein LOC112570787 [Pomacea canaliculata]
MEPSPYDNVEFGPVGRKSGTGTWPGPQGTQSTTTTTTTQQASRFSPQQQLLQAKDRTGLVGAKLEPLEETVETAESHDQRMQAVKQQASSIVSPSSSSQSSYFHRGGTGLGVGGGAVAGGGSDGGGVKTANNAVQLLSMSAAPTSSTSSSVKPSSASTTTTTMSSGLKTTINPAAEQPKSTSNAVNAPTYVLTQVGEVKDKTAIRNGDDDDEFKRHDLDPPSRAALETAYKMQREFYRLNSRILDEGTLLKQDVMDIYRKAGETFSYEQLLQGMLEDGEMLLLGGCWLHYMHVEFKDETGEKTVRQPYGKGRLCLTNNRVLLLSAEIYSDASLEPYGDPQKKGGYKLEVSKRNAIIFRNIPLSCFYSAELEVNVGTSAQTKITARRRPCCWSACTCCFSSWTSTPPMTRSFNERVVRMGVALPPWGTHGFIVVHLDPGQSLTTARDFVAQLHQHSPHMH